MPRIGNERLKQVIEDGGWDTFPEQVEHIARELWAYRESGALEALRGAASFYTKRQRTLAEKAITKLEAIQK